MAQGHTSKAIKAFFSPPILTPTEDILAVCVGGTMMNCPLHSYELLGIPHTMQHWFSASKRFIQHSQYPSCLQSRIFG
eukprot:g34592.t1